MERHVEPELLDALPAADPGAAGSRNDIQRLSAWMGSAATMARALARIFHTSRDSLTGRSRRRESAHSFRREDGADSRRRLLKHEISGLGCASPDRTGRRLADLGAGDGRFLLRVAKQLAGDWAGTEAVLVDRQEVVRAETREAFDRLGWRAVVVKSDVFDWLGGPAGPPFDGIVANLFLHHFSAAQVTELLAEAAKRTRVFVAVEPCRSSWAYAASRLVWAIGCNGVTRHDAPISVHAGFAGRELSRLWPADGTWHLAEQRAGCFGHLFVAQRLS